MAMLNEDQEKVAIEVMKAYLESPNTDEGLTPVAKSEQFDRDRVAALDSFLKPLLSEFLRGSVKLADFKSQIDGFNKRNDYWGFRGPKGQMFFNMTLNVASDLVECESEIKTAIEVPRDEDAAARRIRAFVSYINRIGAQHLESGGEARGRPRPASAPFFLSYFWQIQNRDVWPMFYTASIDTINDLNLWRPSGEPGADYIAFKALHEELARLFQRESGRKFSLYDVEHVFWYHKQTPETERGPRTQPDRPPGPVPPPLVDRLPESYVPPVVAVLPAMARSEAALRDAAKASGTSLERAFEKSIDAAFAVLGYETKLLGQGQGRVPDGLALETDNSYAIIWDAKVRGGRYSFGTDDRAVREYITTQSRELKRRKGYRNIYYFIVSGSFGEDYEEIIRSLKMETDVNEVLLVEAEALVAMVDARLRAPREVGLGSDGLQRLFTTSGLLTANDVREALA